MSTTTRPVQELRQRFTAKRDSIIEDYLTFLRFPSISTDPEYATQVLSCMRWLKQYLGQMPLHIEEWETPRYPVLFASYDGAGPNQPTLLIYNHYDVQPVDPLDLWKAPPFEPTIRDGEVYARGAADNKGQCFYVIQALKALFERDGKLPVNIKLIIEGEEECGSLGLSTILKKKTKELQADYLLVVDVGIANPTEPSVTMGVRGIVTMDVSCQGSHTDMHSGMVGGIVYNPIHALVEILSKLRTPTGKIAVPHFYDTVKPLSAAEKTRYKMDFKPDEFKKEFGAEPTGGEQEFTPLERAWTRPTIEINGISGGYAGFGFKTVIPALASAKVSCRLVPDQDPQKIAKAVCDFLIKQAPPGIKVTAKMLPGCGSALRADSQSPLVKVFMDAFTEVFGRPCEQGLCGGSIPIITELQQASGGQTLLVGLGLPGDCVHAPNEHFGLDRIEKGYLIIARALEQLAESSQ